MILGLDMALENKVFHDMELDLDQFDELYVQNIHDDTHPAICMTELLAKTEVGICGNLQLIGPLL